MGIIFSSYTQRIFEGIKQTEKIILKVLLFVPNFVIPTDGGLNENSYCLDSMEPLNVADRGCHFDLVSCLLIL